MGNRKLKSIKQELIVKAREAMLTAVQVFNNPNIQFKSENFVILSNIAWMYLLHAYYRHIGVDYRYYTKTSTRKKYDKTKHGAFKHWELERCLNDKKCPIDKVTIANLKFLIGLRHEIEHQMTTKIDDYLSARFQACCLNFNQYIKQLFGECYSIDKHLSFSLQFSTLDEEQVNTLRNFTDLPANIASFINKFDENLSDEDFNDIKFSYRVMCVPKSVNHKGQADKVIEFIPANSPEAQGLNREYILVKEKEKAKYLPTQICDFMKQKGYVKFNIHQHTLLWKEMDAKNIKFSYGVQVAKAWYWYENWVKFV